MEEWRQRQPQVDWRCYWHWAVRGSAASRLLTWPLLLVLRAPDLNDDVDSGDKRGKVKGRGGIKVRANCSPVPEW